MTDAGHEGHNTPNKQKHLKSVHQHLRGVLGTAEVQAAQGIQTGQAVVERAAAQAAAAITLHRVKICPTTSTTSCGSERSKHIEERQRETAVHAILQLLDSLS